MSSSCSAFCKFLAATLFVPLTAAAQNFLEIGTVNDAQIVATGNRTLWAAASSQAPSIDTFMLTAQTNDFVRRPLPSDQFTPMFMASGGGSMIQPDETWAHFPSGEFRFDQTLQQWVQPPNVGRDINARRYVVGVGYGDNCHPYEAWVERVDLTTNNHYLARFDFCRFGGIFVAVPGFYNAKQVAIGGGEVWSIDTAGNVFRFNSTSTTFDPMPGSLSQIAVGVDGVWGINSKGAAFEFNPVTQSWDALVSPQLDAIWAGGDGVFARECTGGPVIDPAAARPKAATIPDPLLNCAQRQLMRYEPVTRRFVAIQGNQPMDLSVGSGAGAAGIWPPLHIVMVWSE